MSSKIKQYFANKENRIKCGITGGTIALAVIIFVGMVFMEENETQNNSIETVSQTESDTQTEEETGYSFDAGDLYDMRLDAQTIEDYYMKSCGDQFNLYTIDKEMCIICVVGDLEWENVGFEAKALDAMRDIPVRMISFGGSNYNISFLIRECDKKVALQSLSDMLFNSK